MPRWNLLAIGNKRVAPERQIVFPAGDLPNSSDHANGNSRNAISPVGTSRHFAATGGPSLVQDGDFGQGTPNAVKSFQTAMGLGSNGLVGTDTWKKSLDFIVP